LGEKARKQARQAHLRKARFLEVPSSKCIIINAVAMIWR